ncbi:MAG: hypothetical protein IT481_11350 [Gammaproteobacteria bacterium]|nr:hypothetical protein [Gammaproteobacteria bacterium]
MLALVLLALECLEVGLLLGVASWAADAGLGVVGALALVVALAFAWRSLLVLASHVASGSGWPGWRLWLDETTAFTLAYVAMTVEPLRYGGRSRRGGEAAGCAIAPAAGPRLVLLHGWCCNAGVWQTLRAVWLRQCAAPPPIAVTLTPVFGDIDRMCRNLSRQLAPLLARREPLVLVAHSMGGLVARRWLQQDAAAARLVVGLLTVGTPHAGTRLARLGPGRAATQMRPGSDWLAALAAMGPSCPVCCVWSDTDGFVAPARSALLPHAASVALHGRGHFGLLRDAQLPPLVMDWLARCASPTAALQPASAIAPQSLSMLVPQSVCTLAPLPARTAGSQVPVG